MTCEMYEDHMGVGVIVIGRPSVNQTRCPEPARYRTSIKISETEQVCLSQCVEHALVTRYPREMFKHDNPGLQLPRDYSFGEVVWMASLPHEVVRSELALRELRSLAAS